MLDITNFRTNIFFFSVPVYCCFSPSKGSYFAIDIIFLSIHIKRPIDIIFILVVCASILSDRFTLFRSFEIYAEERFAFLSGKLFKS